MARTIKKSLFVSALIRSVYKLFCKIPDPKNFSRQPIIPPIDHLMSGLAVFGLKCLSLLDFDRKCKNLATGHHLRSLYHIKNPPSDTHLRERLDEVDPNHLRPVFKKLFSTLQRGKELDGFRLMNDPYLLSIDGTGEFSSGKISCKHCCKGGRTVTGILRAIGLSQDSGCSKYHRILNSLVRHEVVRREVSYRNHPYSRV